MNESPDIHPTAAPRAGLPMLMAIGPGIVVAGSVMGSGELINTPIQAATFGFVLLWAVLLSCVIKYFIQVELARHCMVHNRTTVEALNHCPGPKPFNTSWVALAYMLGYTVSLAAAVGMIGAIAGLLDTVAPWPWADHSVTLWAVLVVLLTQALLWRGLYSQLEKLVTLLVGGFSLSVVVSLMLLQSTDYRVNAAELAEGLSFSLGDQPKLAAYAVVSLLGALGTTANELFMYPYWILEKGYAKRVGPRDADGWRDRARGWTRVLQIDAGCTTLLATVVTAAYFLLGSSVLHRRGVMPQGLGVVHELSAIFTESFGQWSFVIFVFGALCTLFSTVVVVVAATGRMWADVLCSMRIVSRASEQSVRRCHRVVQTLTLAVLLFVFVVLRMPPAKLVIFGQFFVGAFNTPLLILGITWLAFRTERQARMGRLTAALLLATVTLLLTCIGIGLSVKYELF
jgi:Mn2+/Fe2+ NRAMP family transporter